MKTNQRTRKNKGMTYIELAVVLGIFLAMTLIIIFDYNKFQTRTDIKILANDIALKVVEASKDSLFGRLPARTYNFSLWRPSYGLYFDLSSSQSFFYFADLDESRDYDVLSACPGVSGSSDECLESITITKSNFISAINGYSGGDPTPISPVSITFRRPDSGAVFKSSGSILSGFDYMQITVSSPSSISANIKVYPSGRIQVN